MFNIYLFILSTTSILIEERRYYLNEVNVYKNNYSLKSIDTSKLENVCSFLVLQKIFPLSLNISNDHIIRLYMLCIDLITEEDLSRIDSILVKCKKTIDIPIGSSGLFSGSCFSKPLIFIKYKEIFEYISTNSFFKDLDPEALQEYSNYLNSKLYFKMFSSRIVFVSSKSTLVYNLTIPEYFILGIYSYLRNNIVYSSQQSQKQMYFEQLISCI